MYDELDGLLSLESKNREISWSLWWNSDFFHWRIQGPPLGKISFLCRFRYIIGFRPNLRDWHPPWEILDPPLLSLYSKTLSSSQIVLWSYDFIWFQRHIAKRLYLITALITASADPSPSGGCTPEESPLSGCSNNVNMSALDPDRIYFTFSPCHTPKVTAVTPLTSGLLFVSVEDDVTITGEGFSTTSCNVRTRSHRAACDIALIKLPRF